MKLSELKEFDVGQLNGKLFIVIQQHKTFQFTKVLYKDGKTRYYFWNQVSIEVERKGIGTIIHTFEIVDE